MYVSERRGTIREQMAEVARTTFWRNRRVPDMLARRLAQELPLSTEALSRECEVFDATLPDEKMRMISVARRLCRKHGVTFPEDLL